MKQLFVLTCLLVSLAQPGYPQNSVPQWSVHEITLAAAGNYANPYTQTGVSAVFRGPGGLTRTVPGFWDGGSTFSIRFAPTLPGKWSWSTTSGDAGLDKCSGEITCTAPRPGRHGFLRRDQTHRNSFVWDDGTRCFMWGQTYYDVMLNLMAGGGWKEAVDNTAAHGMNKIRLHVFAQKTYKTGVEDMTYPQAVPFGGTLSLPDRDQLNLAYWQGLDEYVRYVDSKGLIADLIPFNPYGENVMWGTQEQDERYLRYILARYAAYPHVIWCVCNEWNYATKPQSYFDRMGEIIRDEDPWMKEGANLRALSIHQGTRIEFNFVSSAWPVHSIIQYGVRNNVQNARPETTRDPKTRYYNGDEWGNASIVFNLGHDMPVVNDEYGYIGEKAPIELTQTQHRQAMWGIAAAGGYGSVGDYRRLPPGNPEITGDWMDAPEYDDIRRTVSFFNTKGLEYWKMASHNALVTAGERIYVLAEPARQYLFYAAVGGTFTAKLAPGTYAARRYDPRTGEDVSLPDQSGGGSVSFTLPDTNDWVVYLKNKVSSKSGSPATGPLRIHPTNPRYFMDGSGKVVYLTAAHTWANLQEIGITDPPSIFDYDRYLKFLTDHNHNFIRLWRWETPKDIEKDGIVRYCGPHPWKRTGPGMAWDGKPKFNLEQFDEGYFERMRKRVAAARDRGIYVSIMLFEGWGLQFSNWDGHPLNANNNINGINGDTNGDGHGIEVQIPPLPAGVEKIQKAYVQKVIDTVNDLDNVLYEIANESGPYSTDWQYDMIRYVKSREALKPKQHPVGMTFQYKNGSNSTLFSSPADWISPNPDTDVTDAYNYKDNPPPADGKKVILSDTDHLWGVGGDRIWAWKSFLRGLNPLWMDPYDGLGWWEPVPVSGEDTRRSLGYTRTFADKVNLAAMTPQNILASTAYCLANPGSEYLVYQPASGAFTVNLVSGTYSYEWFNPSMGSTISTGSFAADGGQKSFSPPFSGDALLYLKRSGPYSSTPSP